MISKTDFCKVLHKLQETSEHINKINDVLGAVVDVGDLSDTVIELLEKLMGVETNDFYGSDISFFCWELNFGKSWTPNSLTQDDKSIDISTAEKLYDYLIS